MRTTPWLDGLDGAITDGSAGTPPSAILLQRLRRHGLSAEEAGNIVARLRGIPPVPGGWTAFQIDHLLFARWLVAQHRLDG